MHLRRDRIHHHGKTNKDFKMIDTLEQQSSKTGLSDSKTLAAPKPKKFSQLLDEKSKRIAVYQNPVLETKTSAKKFYQHHQVGYPRFAQLEEKELRKRVYCGDSNVLFYEESIKKEESSPFLQRMDKEKLAFQKREENATTIQETQLVGVGENKETLEGKVDIEKVRDIRRAIRRRYANRKNFQKIFNLWDEDSVGAITVKNLYNMIHRLGIKINIDEARVLLASADRDSSNDLGLDEFLDLIFNDRDALNVNLQSLPVLTDQQKDNLLHHEETIDFLRQDAQKQRETRHQNQVNLILKNRVLQLGQWLQQQDQLQKGYVNFSKFEGVIKKLEIDNQIVTDQDIHILYDKFKNQDETLDYKKFIQHLKQFQLNEELYQDPYEQKEQQVDHHYDKKQELLMEMKNQQQQKINVFDLTRVNGWHLERMRTRQKNLMAKLQRYIPTKDKFDQFLQSKSANQQNLSLNEFKHALVQFLESVNEQYHKFDIESILSVIQFGQHEIQTLPEISRILYDETDQDFFDRAQLRKKQPPPPQKGEPVEKQHSTSLHSLPQTEYFAASLGMKPYPENQSKELYQILANVEKAVFNKSERAYKIFTDFDKDRDGYISQKDLTTKIQEMNILDKSQVQMLVDYVDPTNKGFVTFNEFNSKIRAGMTFMDSNGTQLINTNTQPTKSTVLAQKQFLPDLQKQVEEFKQPFRPRTNLQQTRPATRFGSTPPYKNTFENIIPKQNTPQYIPPEGRFNKNREQFIQDEKQKNSQQYEQKLERIRSYQQQIDHRIKSAQECSEKRDQNHLKSKAMAQWTYEHKAHLKNDYL